MRTVALWVLLNAAAFTQSSPQTMTKIVVRLQSPDIPQASFAAQPKTMYRAGTRYCRIEELPDPQNGIHALVIINEPDIWMANLLTKTARHQIDPGPSFNCRLPMFADDRNSAANAPDQLAALEFGHELSYFTERKAVAREGPKLQGKDTNAYVLELGDSELLLFTAGTPERPVAVARQAGDKREIYWYTVYEEVPFDAKLFARPEGIKVEELKQ